MRRLQSLTAHFASAAELVPPRASSAAAQKWAAAADELMEQSESFRTKHIAALQQCEQQVEETVQTAFADLQQQVRFLTGTPVPHEGSKEYALCISFNSMHSAQADQDACRSSSTLHDAHKSLYGYGYWPTATTSCSQCVCLDARFLLALTGTGPILPSATLTKSRCQKLIC